MGTKRRSPGVENHLKEKQTGQRERCRLGFSRSRKETSITPYLITAHPIQSEITKLPGDETDYWHTVSWGFL